MVDIDSLRKHHENPTEWRIRREFLLQNKEKLDPERLECLSHCFINAELYGNGYPEKVMQQGNDADRTRSEEVWSRSTYFHKASARKDLITLCLIKTDLPKLLPLLNDDRPRGYRFALRKQTAPKLSATLRLPHTWSLISNPAPDALVHEESNNAFNWKLSFWEEYGTNRSRPLQASLSYCRNRIADYPAGIDKHTNRLDCAKTADVKFFKGNDLRPATGIMLSSNGKRVVIIIDLDELSCHRRHIDQVEFTTGGQSASCTPAVSNSNESFIDDLIASEQNATSEEHTTN
ncbi:hypothetical protein CSKR_102975 [Clonorchis sinensis]|uniref:Uncharacterized protein n=1 Tax=Clonorchis sinensis TaxID=79923 RepID=A0A3R7GEI2_CLOSI|nr:hypothetical protein CSKR_102975 [Clonorchis sinensis]